MWPWTHSCASCCCCLNMETSGWRPRLNSHLDVEERPRLSQRPDEECQKCFTERRQKGSSCRGKEKTAVLGETFFTQSTSRCLWLCCSSSSPSSSFLLFLFLFPVQRAARESPEIPAAHKQDRTHTSTAQHCETTLPPPHSSTPHRPPLTFPVFSRSVCLRPCSLEGAYTSCFHWSAEVKSADKQDGVHHNRTPAGGEQNHLQEGGGTAETVEN